MRSPQHNVTTSTVVHSDYDQIMEEFLDTALFSKAKLVFNEDNAGYFLKVYKLPDSKRYLGIQIFKPNYILDIKSIPPLANTFNESINKLDGIVDIFFDLRQSKFNVEMSQVLRGDLTINPLLHVVKNNNLGAILTLTSFDTGYGAINMFLSFFARESVKRIPGKRFEVANSLTTAVTKMWDLRKNA